MHHISSYLFPPVFNTYETVQVRVKLTLLGGNVLIQVCYITHWSTAPTTLHLLFVIFGPLVVVFFCSFWVLSLKEIPSYFPFFFLHYYIKKLNFGRLRKQELTRTAEIRDRNLAWIPLRFVIKFSACSFLVSALWLQYCFSYVSLRSGIYYMSKKMLCPILRRDK